MSLSPRQLYAWLDLNDRLDAHERAAGLVLTAVGAQGDGNLIEKTRKELIGRWR
jgi:hypothetical protein